MSGEVTLTTDRLILREFREDDWRATLAYQSDPLYLRFYPWAHRTEEDVRAFLGTFLDQQAERPRHKFQFALVLKEDGRLIGSGGIRVRAPESRQADIGYELNPRCWGRGLATEAARALLHFGFEDLGMHRLFGECVADNIASARVMEAIGMRREAHLREQVWFKGRWWDSVIYAVLEEEWRASTPGTALTSRPRLDSAVSTRL